MAAAAILKKTINRQFDCSLSSYTFYLPSSVARSATRRYLIYSEADFEVFLPAGATRCTDWGEIWRGGGPLLEAIFHANRCNVSPLRGEKPQNRPLSKLNTDALHFAQCCQ